MPDKTPTRTRKPPASAWKPGQSGNPKGRPQGSRNKATLLVQALIDGQAEALVQKAVELALSGDGPALRVLLERICPPRKDSPIALADLPRVETAEDVPAAMAAILEAVATGQVTPGEGQALAGLVEHQRRAIETSDLERRLRAIEERHEN